MRMNGIGPQHGNRVLPEAEEEAGSLNIALTLTEIPCRNRSQAARRAAPGSCRALIVRTSSRFMMLAIRRRIEAFA
jgi:hypothetical protein